MEEFFDILVSDIEGRERGSDYMTEYLNTLQHAAMLVGGIEIEEVESRSLLGIKVRREHDPDEYALVFSYKNRERKFFFQKCFYRTIPASETDEQAWSEIDIDMIPNISEDGAEETRTLEITL
jgi:hypothetical protein